MLSSKKYCHCYCHHCQNIPSMSVNTLWSIIDICDASSPKSSLSSKLSPNPMNSLQFFISLHFLGSGLQFPCPSCRPNIQTTEFTLHLMSNYFHFTCKDKTWIRLAAYQYPATKVSDWSVLEGGPECHVLIRTLYVMLDCQQFEMSWLMKKQLRDL